MCHLADASVLQGIMDLDVNMVSRSTRCLNVLKHTRFLE